MTGYVNWVIANPILSAAIQFAILGTLGEIISSSLKKKRPALPGTLAETAGKVLAWALLGIIIKYGFAGMKGFTLVLIEKQMLPLFCADGWGWAFSLSVLTNLFFGPQMMFFHRLEDNLIARKWNMTGLTTAWWTLIWFWIPVHTVTFALPVAYQIGMAAIWGLVLGIILGQAKKSG